MQQKVYILTRQLPVVAVLSKSTLFVKAWSTCAQQAMKYLAENQSLVDMCPAGCEVLGREISLPGLAFLGRSQCFKCLYMYIVLHVWFSFALSLSFSFAYSLTTSFFFTHSVFMSFLRDNVFTDNYCSCSHGSVSYFLKLQCVS